MTVFAISAEELYEALGRTVEVLHLLAILHEKGIVHGLVGVLSIALQSKAGSLKLINFTNSFFAIPFRFIYIVSVRNICSGSRRKLCGLLGINPKATLELPFSTLSICLGHA